MNIQAEKLELMRLILETDSQSKLETVRRFLIMDHESDFWETLPQFQKDEILVGLQQIVNGETVDYSEFMQKHRPSR